MNEARISVVEVYGDDGETAGTFFYVNGKLTHLPVENEFRISEYLPSDCLNSTDLATLMPKNLSDFVE